MASSDPRFDDSSDEEDFNPAPADMSDEEPEQRREQKRRKSPVHDDEEEEEQNTSPARPKHLDDDDEDEDEEEEEDGGKGRNDDDEEEEEDDDDEDDVQRVRTDSDDYSSPSPSVNSLTCRRAIAESAVATAAMPSSISKPKSTTRTKPKTTRRKTRKLAISSITSIPTISPILHVSMMTDVIASSIAAATWNRA